MVNNYLVSAVRPVQDGWLHQTTSDLHRHYREMYDLSLASYKKFVKEPFKAILWTDPVKNNDEYTVANWEAIKQLWHSEPCNIFWAGADTLMTQPTSLFSDRFKEYRLFNYTDPKQYREFTHYFNDDVQYYPHTMSKDVWELGESIWSTKEGHPDRFWGFDQQRHNKMFWSQDIPESDRFHPEYAYQAMKIRQLEPGIIEAHNQWNRLDIRRAHILHFHASRGSSQVVDLMRFICKELGII